jgi:hypothetical protein
MMFSPDDSTANERRHVFAADELSLTESIPPVRVPRTTSALRITRW